MKSEIDYLLDLVAIPSVSSISNRRVIDYALRQLNPKSWKTNLFSYRDAAGLEKVNLVAVTRNGTGTESTAELALVS